MRSHQRVTQGRKRHGFTLVELLVAVLLIDTGVLAMVAATAMLARRQRELHARASATQLASNRVQRLLAGPCIAGSGTALSTTGETEHWNATLLANAVRELSDSVVFVVNATERHAVVRSRLKC